MNNDISIECTVTATSDEMANGIFKLATQRLLNVNSWNELNGSLLSNCQLMDDRGVKVDRDVHTNDYLKIHENIDQSPESFKWIKVESVQESLMSGGTESIVLQTRPASNPWNHSFDRALDSTGVISIVRKGLNITARVHAKAQNDIVAHEVVDRMKNISAVVYSTLGAYCVQWRSLVNAILGDLREVEQFPGGPGNSAI
ncbi:MAG: hypothetical protein ABJA70_09350 [Chryseolinea sp.]